jgi:hypothetical protein
MDSSPSATCTAARGVVDFDIVFCAVRLAKSRQALRLAQLRELLSDCFPSRDADIDASLAHLGRALKAQGFH